MSNMGSSCSIRRSREKKKQIFVEGSNSYRKQKTLRHSVESELPDETIANLYPIHDNYVMVSSNLRSPKSLFDLCVEQVCRSLPDLDGELPQGLPQDLVSAIVKSLTNHSALNATTLRALKNCELGELPLAGCRGVRDDWLRAFCNGNSKRSLILTSSAAAAMPLSKSFASSKKSMPDTSFDLSCIKQCNNNPLQHGNAESSSSCSTSSFKSASSRLPLEQNPSLPVTSTITILDLRGSQRLTDRGLLQLRDLNLLQVAKLDNCYSLLGKGLLAFASSISLHTLSLANCRRLTDEGIINVSHLTSLNALSLDGCRCLTNQSLHAIQGLVNLTKLDLSQCDLITDDGLHHLENLHLLQELSIGWCRNLTDRGLQIICHQPFREQYLQIFRLSRCCAITDLGISYASALTQLRELDLNGCANIGSCALGATLENLKFLTSLDVSYCPGILRMSWQNKINKLQTLELAFSQVQDRHVSKLTHLPELREINFDSCPIGDWAISHLADNRVTPNLVSLDLADTEVTDLGLAHIPKFQKLAKLSLFYCNISNAGLRHLSKLESLEVLNLDSREICDEGLCYLKNLKNLKRLDVFSGRVTDIGCEYLSHISSLEGLELCGGGVGDVGCAHLSRILNLTSLNLSQNERITNRGAAALANLTNLRALNLSNTRVNPAALRFLGRLNKLQSLALYGCRGIEDSASIRSLHDELPSLKCLRLDNKDLYNDGDSEHVADDEDEMLEDDDDMEAENSASALASRELVNAARYEVWDERSSNSSDSNHSGESIFDEIMNEDEEDVDIGDNSVNDPQDMTIDDEADEEFHRAHGYFSDDASEE